MNIKENCKLLLGDIIENVVMNKDYSMAVYYKGKKNLGKVKGAIVNYYQPFGIETFNFYSV